MPPSSPRDLSQRRSIILFLPPLSPVHFRTNSEPSKKEHLSCLLSVFLELRFIQSQHLLHSESRNLWYFPMGLASKSSFSQFAPVRTRLSSWGQQQSSSAPVNMASIAEAGGQVGPLGGAGMAAGVTSNQFWVWFWQLSCLGLSFPHAWSLSKHCSVVFLGVLWIIQQPFHNPFSWCNQPGSVSVACKQGFCPNEYQGSKYHFLMKRRRGQNHRWLLGCGLSSKDKDKQGTGQDSAARQENAKSGQMFTVMPERRNLTWAEFPEVLWN